MTTGLPEIGIKVAGIALQSHKNKKNQHLKLNLNLIFLLLPDSPTMLNKMLYMDNHGLSPQNNHHQTHGSLKSSMKILHNNQLKAIGLKNGTPKNQSGLDLSEDKVSFKRKRMIIE
jgi:hypothetical protein